MCDAGASSETERKRSRAEMIMNYADYVMAPMIGTAAVLFTASWALRHILRPCIRDAFTEAFDELYKRLHENEFPRIVRAIEGTGCEVDRLGAGIRADVKTADAGIRGDLSRMAAGIRSDLMNMETGIRGDLKAMESRLRSDLMSMVTGIRSELMSMETGIRGDLRAMESRLGDQIDQSGARLEAAVNRLIEASARSPSDRAPSTPRAPANAP